MRLVNLKRDNIGHSIDKRNMRIMDNDTIDPRSMADRRSQDFIGLKQRKLEPIELASMKTHTLVSTIEQNANETKNFDTEPYINKETIDLQQTPHYNNLGASDGIVMADHRSRVTSSTHESQKQTPYEQLPDQSSLSPNVFKELNMSARQVSLKKEKRKQSLQKGSGKSKNQSS